MVDLRRLRDPGSTGLGVAGPAAGPAFPVAPAEAFRPGSGFRVSGAPARAIAVFASRRPPPHAWRRGVPLPPGMVREERAFAVAWAGVAPVDDTHGEVGLLDPEAVLADLSGERLPGAGALASEAAAMLEELESLAVALSVERRVVLRLAQIAALAGVGTAAGIRLRLALTHVQWPLLVGADEERLAAAFRALIATGRLAIAGRSLIIPWEAWPGYARVLEEARGGEPRPPGAIH
jgi:hypothetical protein